MGTTFKHAPKRWSSEPSDGSSIDGGRPAVAAEDIFDDPSILRELSEANASLAHRYYEEPKRSVQASLPPVDAFDFEEACRAKSLANKFGPQGYPPGSHRRRWSFAVARGRQGAETDRAPEPMKRRAVRRGGKSAIVWGCTALAIVILTPAVVAMVWPMDALPPVPVGKAGSDTDDTATAGGADPPAAETADHDSDPNETVVVRNPPAPASIIAPATTAFAAPLVRPTAIENDFDVVDSPTALRVDEPPTGAAAPELAAPPSGTRSKLDSAAEDFTRMAQSQLSVNAGPPKSEVLQATASEVVPAERTDGSPISGEQVDRLLARGEELLRSGNIASARLLFLRVAAAGDRRGAKAVGMTYDPKVYARLPIMGLAPDLEQAELWYAKAGEDVSYTIDLTLPLASAEAAESAEEPALRQWNASCARKYRSFEPGTGLYTGNSGIKRRCRLP